MDTVTLPPDLERFAEAAVAAGRYRDIAELVAAGVDLLRRREEARAAYAQAHALVKSDPEKHYLEKRLGELG